MRITKSAVVRRKQGQPPSLRVHHLEIAPELRCLASKVSLLCRRPSSSELQRRGQKALLSVTSCQEQAFSPRRKLQARRRDWNITQRAARFAAAPENHRLCLWKGRSSFQFSPLPLPLRLRVAPERAAGGTQVF